MKNLGCANSWSETPVEVNVCKGLEHQTEEKKVGRCQYQTTCKICGYVYLVDCSD